MSPREADPLDVTAQDEARWARHPLGRPPYIPPSNLHATASYRPVGYLLAAFSGALVGLLAGFLLAGVASAAPRSGSLPLGEDAGRSEAPHGASPFAPPSTTETRLASGEASPDLRTPPATSEISAAIGGQATWFCGAGSPCTRGYGPSDLIAAIDPTLGIAKGERLTVHYRGRSVAVQVVDVCACGGSRIIDLSRIAFAELADPSLGVIPVSIEFGPSVTLPPTSTDR